MSEHTTEVSEFIERPSAPDAHPSLTFSDAAIVVRPPIKVGEKFRDAILGVGPGRRKSSVTVSEVVSTQEATVLLATSGRGDEALRHADIMEVASRVGQLANAPETALQMMADFPFPMTQHEYGL